MKKKLTAEELEKKDKAKQELKEYRENVTYIKEKRDDIEEYIALIEGTTPKLSYSNTSSNSVTDKIGNSVGRLEALKKDMNEKLEKLLLRKFLIDNKIDKLNYPYRDILFMRYSRIQDWREIANKLHYDEQYIKNLHGDALILYGSL